MYQNIEIIDRAIKEYGLDAIIHGKDFLKAKSGIREKLNKIETEKAKLGLKNDMNYSLSFISDAIKNEADKESIIKAALEYSSMDLMVEGASLISLRNGNGTEFIVEHAKGSDKRLVGSAIDELERKSLCWTVYSFNEPVIDGKYLGVPINELGEESKDVLGMIIFANKLEGSGSFTRVDKEYANNIAKLVGIVKGRDNVYGWVIDRLSAAMEQKDRYTGNHCRDVMHNCIAMGEAYGLSDASKDRLALASLLHDLGKLCVDDSILKKPGRLDKDEWDIIKQHPWWGAHIIERSEYLKLLAEFIISHHERPDGKGYPAGTRNIPLSSSIIAIADTYDAMTSDRPYRKGLPHEVAHKEINDCSGTQFLPEAVDVYNQCVRRGTWRVSERSE